MADYVEPLDAALWFQRIDMIANGTLASVENSLRHASHLLQLTPRPLRPMVALSIDEERFEALLVSGDFDTAARYLLSEPSVLSIEGAAEVCVIKATIQCSVLNRAIVGTGETVAKAVLDAWTTSLLAIKTEYGANLDGLVERLPPEGQSGQCRRSSSL